MTLPITPETLPRKAVELIEFIEWLERNKQWFLYDSIHYTIDGFEIREAVAEYMGLRLCPACQETRPQKQFGSNDGKFNRTKCMRCSAPPRKHR